MVTLWLDIICNRVTISNVFDIQDQLNCTDVTYSCVMSSSFVIAEFFWIFILGRI